MIAIESPAPLPAPDFSLNASAPSVSVVAGNSVGNQINLAVSNFTGTVTFGYSVVPASSITAGFSPASLTTNGSTAITLAVPANAAPGAYTVTVTGTSANPSSRNTTFTVNVTAPSTAPQSAVFGAGQFLSGGAPTTFTSLPNWRFESRLHFSPATLPNGTSTLVGMGSLRLIVYRYGTGAQLSYSLIMQDGTSSREFWLDLPDIFVRVQRSGSQLILRAWKVQADGSLAVPAGTSEDSAAWSAATTLSPGFSLGAGTDQAGPDRYPLNGAMAFFRFFDSAASNATLPNQCDSASALIRYEFESSLINAGSGSATLTPTGSIGYQNTPATSCALGGTPPSFSLISGTQSPSPVPQGQSSTYPLTINRQNFTGLVTITGCSGPAGVTCSAPATTGTSTQLTVTTSAATPVTAHSLLLTATGPGVPNATASVFLNVSNSGPPPPTFSLQVTPPNFSFTGSGTQNLTVTLYPGPGFTGNVNFTCAGVSIPSQLTCVAPNPASDVQPQRVFSITATAGAPQGTYNFTLTGTGPAAQTATANIQVTLNAAGIRGFVYPDSRELSVSPGAYYQFLSTVEGSTNSQVNWGLSPALGGLTTTYPFPATPPTSATAGPANYVFYYPPPSVGASQNVALSGTPAVGGQPGYGNILLRGDPYAPPVICRPPNPAGCANETYLPTVLSANAGLTWMRFESHYSGTYSFWSNARLHRTLKVSFALNPDNPWDAGANACIIRIQRSLSYGGVDDQVMSLEGGPSPTSASIGPGTPNTTITNGVCSVNRQYTNMSANFLADSTKAWLDVYIRFNAASAPRYLFYNIDTFNNTSSGTVLMKETPYPVNP